MIDKELNSINKNYILENFHEVIFIVRTQKYLEESDQYIDHKECPTLCKG